MTADQDTIRRKGDLVKLRVDGRRWPGVWRFGVMSDGVLRIRRIGRAAWRSLDASKCEVIDHDAKW